MRFVKFLESVAERIPEGADLTLDVTQGFRHFPFIFYALVLYLTSLRGVTLRGAYYGMVEGLPRNVPKPIIDLQPLLELPEWFHAVRMFRDQGTTSPIAQLLKLLSEQLHQEANRLQKGAKIPPPKSIERYQQSKQVNNAVNRLKNRAFAYESALPLELGKASRLLINPVQTLATMDFVRLPPLADALTNTIASVAEQAAFKNVPSSGNWKQNIPLNKKELERQAHMIDLYLDRDQLSLAVGLMREWVVSWAIWKSGNTADVSKWLNRGVRSLYERRLGAIGAFAANDAFKSTITIAQKEFGGFWNQLGDALRNVLLIITLCV